MEEFRCECVVLLFKKKKRIRNYSFVAPIMIRLKDRVAEYDRVFHSTVLKQTRIVSRPEQTPRKCFFLASFSLVVLILAALFHFKTSILGGLHVLVNFRARRLFFLAPRLTAPGSSRM